MSTYGQFDAPGLYVETDEAEARFAHAADSRDVKAATLRPGEIKALQES